MSSVIAFNDDAVTLRVVEPVVTRANVVVNDGFAKFVNM